MVSGHGQLALLLLGLQQGRSNMAKGHGREKLLPHNSQEAERERATERDGHASGDLFLPARSHLLLSTIFQECLQIINPSVWINALGGQTPHDPVASQ
jgi:hypothetical protein